MTRCPIHRGLHASECADQRALRARWEARGQAWWQVARHILSLVGWLGIVGLMLTLVAMLGE